MKTKYTLKNFGGEKQTNIIDLICNILGISKNENENLDIEFRVYNRNDKKTKYENKEFYNTNELYILTNGANKNLEYGWGGSNSSITSLLGESSFANDKYEIIYEPEDNDDNKYLLGEQAITASKFHGKPAGTTFYIDTLDIKPNIDISNIILGVFHINGLNYRKFKDPPRKKYYEIAKNYYKAIISKTLGIINDNLDKIIKKSLLNDNKKIKINLVLAPIPGEIFNGKEEIHLAMRHAIEDNEIKEALNNLKKNEIYEYCYLHFILGISEADYKEMANKKIDEVKYKN